MVVDDVQMKFLVKKFRELQSEHFGKRGIAWHGAAVLVNRKATCMPGLQFEQVSEDNKRAHSTQVLYLHDILKGNDEQSSVTLVCIVDTILQRLHAMFPEAHTVSFQAVSIGVVTALHGANLLCVCTYMCDICVCRITVLLMLVPFFTQYCLIFVMHMDCGSHITFRQRVEMVRRFSMQTLES